jgi:hypothetical protein
MTEAQACVPAMKAAGFDPADVRYVIQSHLHLDHTGALGAIDQFPNAEVIATRKEYEYPGERSGSAARVVRRRCRGVAVASAPSQALERCAHLGIASLRGGVSPPPTHTTFDRERGSVVILHSLDGEVDCGHPCNQPLVNDGRPAVGGERDVANAEDGERDARIRPDPRQRLPGGGEREQDAARPGAQRC